MKYARWIARAEPLLTLLLAALTAAACAPAASRTATPTVAPSPPAAQTPTPTNSPIAIPMPPTWTLTDTCTPRPPPPTATQTLTPTPFSPAEACAAFKILQHPPAYELLAHDAAAYFIWSEIPPDTQVRLVLTRAREFSVLRADVMGRRNNGIILPLDSVPFSGAIHWQLLLLYEGNVVCRLSGRMQKAAPPFEDLFATASPTAGASPERGTLTPAAPEITASPAGATDSTTIAPTTGSTADATPAG